MATSSNSILINFGAITANFNSSVNNSRSVINNFNKALKDTQRESSNTESRLVSLAKGFIGLAAAKKAGEYLIGTRMEYEKLEAALSATVGADRMQETFLALQKFAQDTPYDLAQTTKAYQRLVLLGLDPSRKALEAYGNIAATQSGKGILDFVEAVADAVVGENERLKEFGIKANATGKQVLYTFQGQTTAVEKNAQAIEKYLISIAGAVAGGKAMSNQAATLSGRLNALKDGFDQVVNNMNKMFGTNESLGGVVDSLSDKVTRLNESFLSGEAQSYFEAFQAAASPVPELINSISTVVSNFISNLQSQGGDSGVMSQLFKPDQLGDLISQLTSFFNEVMGYIELVNQMVLSENFFTLLLADANQTFAPIIDIISNINDAIISLSDNSKQAVQSVSTENQGILSQFTSFMQSFSTDAVTSIDDLTDKSKTKIQLIPIYISSALQGALAYFVYFKNQAIGQVAAIAQAVASLDFSSFKGLAADASAKASAQLDADFENIRAKGVANTEKLIAANAKLTKSYKDVKNAAEGQQFANNLLRDINTARAQDARNTQVVDNLLNNLSKNKDDPLERNGRAAQGPRSPAPAAGGGKAKKGRAGGGGASSSSKVQEEYRQMLRNQEDAENDSYKRSEISIKQHFDNLLKLKLQQLAAEETATTEAVNKNNEIISDQKSTEAQKENAVKGNIALQSKMNGLSEKEKGIRAEIARSLRDAQEDYKDMILGIRNDLEELMGGINFDTAMQNFEKKYRETRKRLAVEDKENGTNYSGILDSIQKISAAQYKIADSARSRNVEEAQYKATSAELDYQVQAGLIGQNDAKKQQIAVNKQLLQDNVDRLQSELEIANAAKGYDPIKVAELRQNLAEAKTALLNFNDDVNTVKEGVSTAFEGFFNSLGNGTKSISEAFKDLASDIVSSINGVISKNLANALMNSLFGASGGGGGADSGLGSGIGSIITSSLSSLFGGAYATGGIMQNGKWNLVGEKGPELVFSGGAGQNKVYNNADSNRMMSGGGVNMYITTPDANSFRKSQAQIQTEQMRNLNRNFNRNS